MTRSTLLAPVLLTCALSARQASADPQAVPPGTSAVLTASDRERFVEASRLFQSGKVASAYDTAKPLFDAYPDNFDVQDLRCQLATVRWLAKDAMLAECAPSTRLASRAEPPAAAPPAPAAGPPPAPPSAPPVTPDPSPPSAEPAAPPQPTAKEPAPPQSPSSAPVPAPPTPRFIVVSAGLGLSYPMQSSGGKGSGFYATGEYVVKSTTWLMPKAYAGVLLTSADTSSCGGAPCDVSAKIGLAGAKVRLQAPIPYVAPFVEVGVGLSFGELTSRTPAADNAPVNFTYHVPLGVGLVLGKDLLFELGLAYLVHPAAQQVDGAFALSLSFPLS